MDAYIYTPQAADIMSPTRRQMFNPTKLVQLVTKWKKETRKNKWLWTHNKNWVVKDSWKRNHLINCSQWH